MALLSSILVFALLAVQASGANAPVHVRVTDLTDTGGEVILCRPFPADGVILVYTHSMYGGDVRERFVPAGRSLRRVEMTTANAAAAEYYATTVEVTRVGERYRVEAPPAEYDEIVVRVDGVGQHRLIVGEETFDLLALTGQAHRIRLNVVRSMPVSHWWGGDDGC